MKIMLPNGYSGPMGYASAATMADFIMVNMVAEAVSGSKTPKEAAERACAARLQVLQDLRRCRSSSTTGTSSGCCSCCPRECCCCCSSLIRSA
jgi:hypothetical protein